MPAVIFCVPDHGYRAAPRCRDDARAMCAATLPLRVALLALHVRLPRFGGLSHAAARLTALVGLRARKLAFGSLVR